MRSGFDSAKLEIRLVDPSDVVSSSVDWPSRYRRAVREELQFRIGGGPERIDGYHRIVRRRR